MGGKAPAKRVRAGALFAAWAGVGALGALGVAALLTVGVAFLVAAVVLAALLLWRAPDQRLAVLGSGLGAALVVGYVGWLNRDGPGTVCHSATGGAVSCADEWTPWPFYLLAVLLAGASIGLFAHLTHAETTGVARPGGSAR